MNLLNRLHDRLESIEAPEPVFMRGTPEVAGFAVPPAGGLLGDRMGQLVVLNLEELRRWAETGDDSGLPQVKEDVELLRDLTQKLRDRTLQQSQATAQSLSSTAVDVGNTNSQLNEVRRRQQEQQAARAQQEARLNALHQQINGYEVNRAQIYRELDYLRNQLAERRRALDEALDEWWNLIKLLVQSIRSAIEELSDLITDRAGMVRRIEEDLGRLNQEVQQLYSERYRQAQERQQLEEQDRQLTREQLVLTDQLAGLEQQQKVLAQRVVLIESVYSFLLEMYNGLNQMNTNNVRSLLRKLNAPVQYFDLNGREDSCSFSEALDRIVRDAGAFLTGSAPLYALPQPELALS